MKNYRTGEFDYEVVDGYCLTVDCGQGDTEGYALAFLKLFNTARECPDMIYKVENRSDSNNVYVYCAKKSLERVEEFCNELVYQAENVNRKLEVTHIGEVTDVCECKFVLIDYDCDLLDDGSDDVIFDKWIIRK
jgi:hypothetical protein